MISTCSCGARHALVIDSRQRRGYTIRRYECRVCEARWSTIELPASTTRWNSAALRRKLELAQELLS